MQAFEGAHNVRITNNAIGPAGVGADKESGHWADGISYAASDGLVAGNLIIDTTDGGIVLFNAPGTLVTSNTVVTKTRLSLGAINMVDFIVCESFFPISNMVAKFSVLNYVDKTMGTSPLPASPITHLLQQALC